MFSERPTRTVRDLQRLSGRRGPKESHAFTWGDIDKLMAAIATRAETSNGGYARSIGTVPLYDYDRDTQLINGRIDNTITYVDNEVALARSDLNATIDATKAEIDVLRDRVSFAEPRIGNAEQLIDDAMDNLAYVNARLQKTAQLVADAGIYLDPDAGVVRIEAVDRAQGRIGTAEIRLDAAEAEINLRATKTYVDDEIAAAVLDPADLQSLEDLKLRVSTVEVDLDAAEADILLKADQLTVDGLATRLSSAEVDIDGLQGEITLKASTAALDDTNSRVTDAEIQLETLGDVPSISQTVYDTRRQFDELDESTIDNLADLLDAYKSREAVRVDLASARTEISAYVNEEREAIAKQRLDLTAMIDTNSANLMVEKKVRADADSAMASDIRALSAEVDGVQADITDTSYVRADGTGGVAARLVTINTEVDQNAAAISDEKIVRADADTALSGRIDTLKTTVDGNTASIKNEEIARTDADNALASDITTLETNFNGLSSSVETNANAISTLESYNSATYAIRLKAGGATNDVEFVAADDPINGPTSSVRFTADDVLFDGTVHAKHLSTNSVTAEKISVTSLSAISATLGLFKSAASGARVEIQDDRILVYNSSGVLVVAIGNLSGVV